MNGHLDLGQRMSRACKLFERAMAAEQKFANVWHRLKKKHDAGQKIRLNEVREFKRLMARAIATNRSANAATRAFAGKHTVSVKFPLLTEDNSHV